MADPKTQADPGALVCPWCSAAVTAETAVCPSCLAILRSDEEHDVPGVTAVDAAGLLARRPPQRSRFLSWLGGDEVEPAATTSDVQAIARPDVDVQREILRLELVAKISNLQAEADSILSDALVEGRVDDLPDDLRSLAGAEASAETPAETADALVEVAMGRPADAAEQANEPTSPAPTEQSDTPRTADLTDQSAPERPA